MKEISQEKRAVKKSGNRVGFGALWYLLILSVVTIVFFLCYNIPAYLQRITDFKNLDETKRIALDVFSEQNGAGVASILGVVVGVAFLFFVLPEKRNGSQAVLSK